MHYNIRFINDKKRFIYNSYKKRKTKKHYNCNPQPRAKSFTSTFIPTLLNQLYLLVLETNDISLHFPIIICVLLILTSQN